MMARTCLRCGSRLGKPNRSGYCRAHFARALHDDPVAESRKFERMRASIAVSPARGKCRARLAALSRNRLAWCPREHQAFYRSLTRHRDFRAAEAKAIVLRHVAAEMSARLVRPRVTEVGV